eukprot:2881879-Rhodomonas_salina.4
MLYYAMSGIDLGYAAIRRRIATGSGDGFGGKVLPKSTAFHNRNQLLFSAFLAQTVREPELLLSDSAMLLAAP